MTYISFNSIIPHIDQIVYSIYMYKADMFYRIKNHLTFLYGSPGFIKERNRYYYSKQNLWLSKPNKHNWSTLTFCPLSMGFDIEDFIRFMSNFKSLRKFKSNKKPKRVQSLKSLELAYDLPLRGYSAEEISPVLFLINQHLLCTVPKFNYTFIKEYDDAKACSDGATNYNITYYWNSFKQNGILNGYKPKRNPKGASTKVYLKKLGGIWHIRFEITFKTYDLDNMFYGWMVSMPTSLPMVFDNLCQRPFKEFFCFANIAYEMFMEETNDDKNKYVENFIDDLNDAAEFDTVTDKLY